MKRERLALGPAISVESALDTNGRYYITYAKGASVFLREAKEVRRFLKFAKSTPSREALDAWLEELAAADSARRERREAATQGLSDEVLATGFGPECHLDESDPNYATRTVV
jgi:hypothetical protein